MDFGISPISIVEEMAKEIRHKSEIECNFYQSVEDVSEPRDLSSVKKNITVFDDLLLEKKTHGNCNMSEEDTATLIVCI